MGDPNWHMEIKKYLCYMAYGENNLKRTVNNISSQPGCFLNNEIDDRAYAYTVDSKIDENRCKQKI